MSMNDRNMLSLKRKAITRKELAIPCYINTYKYSVDNALENRIKNLQNE